MKNEKVSQLCTLVAWCLVATASIAVQGCLDTIALELDKETRGEIVISAHADLSENECLFQVDVLLSQPLEGDIMRQPVSAHGELLFNGQSLFPMLNGEPYQLTITQFENLYGAHPASGVFALRVRMRSGETYVSEGQRFPATVRGATLSTEHFVREELNPAANVITRDYLRLEINTPVVDATGSRASFKYDVYGAYRFVEWMDLPCTSNPFWFANTCYVEAALRTNQISVLNGHRLARDFVEAFEVIELPVDHRFNAGFYFTVVQKSIGADAADYWREVASSITRGGTLFDTPPGRIGTNFVHESGPELPVSGFFYTGTIDTIRHLVSWEDAGRPRHQCTGGTAGREPCCDCLTLTHSTYEKPQYWIE